MRTYIYVGPPELREFIGNGVTRQQIQKSSDVLQWIRETGQKLTGNDEVIATFIVDLDGKLWIADRHSEHVVCATGGPVLSAGEMTFSTASAQIAVVAVTNQSTGFCPEPESWPVVETALNNSELKHPGDFTTKFHFRRCCQCQSINVVKENWFVCGVCDAALDEQWNFNRD